MPWEGIKKTESYTFRMKPQVWEIIQEFEGNGRNDKLENVVHFAFFERNEIQQEIKTLEKQREKLKQEIEDYRKLTDKLKRVQWGVDDLLRTIDSKRDF